MTTENTQTDPAPTDRSRRQGKGTFGLLLTYVYRDKPLLIRVLLLLLLATAADVAGPLLAKVFIDDYLLAGHLPVWPLVGLALGYMVTQVAAAWFRYRQTLRFTEMALAAVLDIRKRVFAHVQQLPMAFFDRAMTGQLVSRITNDTEAIKDLYVQFLSVVLTNVVLLVGIITAMALLNLQLMLVALLLIPTVVGVIYLYQKLSGAAVADSRQLRSDINGTLGESISGMAVVQACGLQQDSAERFERLNLRYYRARMRTINIGAALLRPAIDLLSVLVLLGILKVFGWQLVNGVAEVGVLYAFLNFMGRFTEPLAEITQRFNLYQQAMVAGDRVHRLLQQPRQHYGETGDTIHRGALAFHRVDFGYQAGHPVFRQLSLEIPAGAFIGVVGHTGSGKSTLLNLLLNFYPVDAGHISIDDQPLAGYRQDALRRGIGLIPQEPFILAGSIYDNIDMGRKLPRKQIENAARQAHLLETINGLEQGFDTRLGERGSRLSGGQRQQLVIARALAAAPRILLLDEATANVDSETEQVVQRALQALHGKVTLIVVAHRLSTIKKADRILVMAHGELVESGSHHQLMALPEGRYRAMYRLQQQARQVELAEQHGL
ncbi:ATP-binding cassette subfamily B protein/ATP-binding cassette subfamily C protein/ATP-binding cassette subfamily B multidrug efflux pump [Oceanisphaera litoralis]|uniref:ABC transporter ATP-binding protein n=1 Tax=Oceanisphaera litoralis TaxID=225144 RepID=UPI00195ECDE0|nr:ABC transporter transmembrane domain-containing protein [Oceanisphaera litoralis]MBM7457140.1 ATP-binding cassette subfamily B protein/ATP-binding cassette subfamily C protein/ATP-binding cassette subfamily B multidrug efflux pump [Oceanisphaera litoralis]